MSQKTADGNARTPGSDKDDWCTPGKVDELETALKRCGVRHEIYRYEAAHAFFNEGSSAYDVASANLAWDRVAEFLKKSLA